MVFVVGTVPVFVQTRIELAPSKKFAGSLFVAAKVKLTPLATADGLPAARVKVGTASAIATGEMVFEGTFALSDLPPATTDGKVPVPLIATARTR